MSDDQYRKHIRTLNRKQYEFFVHIVNVAQTDSRQELCCLHGGAGTGKSHVLKALYQTLYCVLCTKAGQSRDDCRILVMAPTGKAAHNVKGTTVHAAFHIPANQSLHEYSPLSHDVLNTYRAKYRHLMWILIDEISMVSNEILKYVHLRLQDIKQDKQPFGGVNIVTIGDLYQLQPVMGQFIFMNLKYGYGPLATNLWQEYFMIYELTEIMRQKDDKAFAELLNRLHVEKHNENDIKTIKKALVAKNHTDELHDIPHFFPARNKVMEYNKKILEINKKKTTDIQAIGITPNEISEGFRKQLIDAIKKRTKKETTGGLEKTVHVAIDHQYDLMTNINVEDCLINGAECCVRHITKNQTNPDFPAIIWVEFEDKNIGKEHRKKYEFLYQKDIKSKFWTPIFAVKCAFKVISVWVHRVQFPLRQAAARTIYEAQSSTYKKIYVDMSTDMNIPKNWWHHMHYVASSRVTLISGLFLADLNETKISVSPDVVNYIEEAKHKKKLQLSYKPMYELIRIIY